MSPRLSMKDIEARASHKPPSLPPLTPHTAQVLYPQCKNQQNIFCKCSENVISMSFKKQEFDNQNTSDMEKDGKENFTAKN